MRFRVPRLTRPNPRPAGSRTFRPQFEALEDRWVPTTLPAGFAETPVATGLTNVTAMNFSPVGTLFVAQQNGQLKVYDPWSGTLQANPFLTVQTTTTGERGLLGVTFDPRWWDGENHCYVYVYYTVPTAPIHNRISRFLADSCENPTRAAGSQEIILELNNLSSATNHNGGGIQFGVDGMMYVGVGENANAANAQNLGNLLGKVLRIDAANYPNIIPADNPFVGVSGAREEIYANGFRNPYSLAIHPFYGWVFVNDVGNTGTTRREEINYIEPSVPDFYYGYGGNFGWPIREGISGDPNFVDPFFAYGPGYGGTNCAIVGGSFYATYEGAFSFPAEYADNYFFGDYCGRWIHRYDPYTGTVTPFATNTTGTSVIEMKVSPFDGTLFYATRGNSTLYQVYYAGSSPGAPGGPGTPAPDGVLVSSLLADSLGSIMPVVAEPARLTAVPASPQAVDELFTARLVQAEPMTVPSARRAATATPADLWQVPF